MIEERKEQPTAQPIYIDRPPRIQPELPIDRIKIPAPPQPEQDALMQLLQMALPLIMIFGFMSMFLFGGTGRSPLLMLPMIVAMGGASVLTIFTFFRQRRLRAEAEKAYRARLLEMNREMHTFHDMQRRFYVYNYPDLPTVTRIVTRAREDQEREVRPLRSESRLWERRSSDDDFGVIRLGMGTLPSTVVYELDKSDGADDPLHRAAQKLQEDSLFVSNIPVILQLRAAPEQRGGSGEGEGGAEAVKKAEAQRTPVTPSLGIAGDAADVYGFTRSVLAHFMAFHTAADARLYLLGSYADMWAWAEKAPHVAGDEAHPQSFFLDRDGAAPGGEGQEESPLELYLEGIRRLLAGRRLQLEERGNDEGRSDPTLPLVLLVVDLLEATADPESPLNNLEGDGAISILLAEGAQLGAAVIFLVPERAKVPSPVKSIVEIQRTTPATNTRLHEFERLHFRYAETGLNSFRYVGVADAIEKAPAAAELVERMSELSVRLSAGAAVPGSVPFMPFMGYGSIEDMKRDAARRWVTTREPQRADWLRARLGIMAGNKARTLVFAAKRDGVHGIVAGSTGSGKSELLISLISAMAIHYDPTILNFVLVDFKGGGAFDPLRSLPHVVDVVTNLNGAAVQRMFTAINAELGRRQRLHSDSGTKDIIEYRRKGLHLHKEYGPYPHLFIIIDEFAEMIAQNPEFKGELESITRIGRSLGVSLILAAQRPSGVTDQMRSNIKYRIALRVESPPESRELLRRPDAAYLPSGIPGRGYLQVGNDEIELIQVAYSGDKYEDPRQPPPPPVVWPDRSAAYDPSDEVEAPPLYTVIVDELEALAHALEVEPQRAPWPNALPARLALTAPLVAVEGAGQKEALTSERYLDAAEIEHILLGQPRPATVPLHPAIVAWDEERNGWIERLDWLRHAARPVVGLVDNPYEAKQHPLVVNFPDGHVVLFGAPGTGKTSFLRTLALSLAASHPPSQLHLYLLDLGGRSLQILEGLPHAGAWITPDEQGYKERVEQLLREMEELVERRKMLLSTARLDDLYEYNARHPEAPQPVSIIAIDNFAEFRESFGGGDSNIESTLERFMALARESRIYGVHFILTATQPNELPMQLYNVFTERLTLKLADPTEYRTLLGASVPDIGDLPGRGYLKMRGQALAFQTATPFRAAGDESLEAVTEEMQRLEELIARMGRVAGPGHVAPKVGALPRSVLFKEILSRQHDLPVDERFLDALGGVMAREWARSTGQGEEIDWLHATFALAPGNRLREMVLEANADGVHGLVAGGTGSGKSELLMTLIIGLAIHYDPTILNFVLVDYKGGGAFKPFEALPHVVDSLSNLNKDAVNRMFTAIIAEMERRQQLNTETKTKHIVEYRQKGYHLTHKPYPHLFIIIDEYAEMIAGSPEFKAQLESIARLGRAQGVNLLLAAQRPIGVTDQMRANIKYRISLRVEEAEISREMLRRPDAAFLPNGMPGRGYLQVGNEGIELIQVAYAGEAQDEVLDPATGEPRRRKFYEAVVDMARALLGERERPMTPWPTPLATAIPFDAPLSERYVEPAVRQRLTQGRHDLLALNPFLRDWLAGRGAWHGVDWNAQALRAIVGLVDDPYGARLLPLTVDLTRGHLILLGASGWGKSTFFRSMVLSLAAIHSPNELHVHLLDLGGRTLEPLRALPHVGTLLYPDEAGYEEQVQQLMRELNDIADGRKRRFAEAGVSTLAEYNRAHPEAIEPALLVVIDNIAEYLESFGNAKEGDPNNMLEALVALVRQARAYGIHFAISALRPNVLGPKLYSLFTERMTLRLADSGDYGTVVGGRAPELPEIAGRGYARVEGRPMAFQVALPPDALNEQGQVAGEAAQIRAVGRAMAAAVGARPDAFREPLRIAALPKSVTFRELLPREYGFAPTGSFFGALQGAVAQRWARNASAEHADWLAVTLGVVSGNRPRTLRLEAKRDGVHGLVAGGTGSGKSELLMTLIVGLALNYSPDILNFVLVDYKGGGAFKPFAGLPHVVDSVTNLNKAAVVRMFTSINAEIRRRMALNADTDTKDIIDYRRRGLHLTREPYPHLFIIIDEYAEMIGDNEEFRDELESITRVGRSLGINLLLASQKPKGVTDQMRANIKLRLCLRVEDTDTSNEMLRRPDAAFLPNGMPGRGYLQIGNTTPELIQVAYTGEAQADDRPAALLWPEHAAAPAAEEEPPRFFDLAVRIARELAGGEMAPPPWPAFLPERFSLETALPGRLPTERAALVPAVSDWLNGEGRWQRVAWNDGALRPPAGLVDRPAEARQESLTFRLDREHLVLFGDAGSGKSSMLRTIAVSLAATHSPAEVHLYTVDMSGRAFRPLEALPHLGAALYAGDDSFDERLRRLLDTLAQLADERSARIAEAGANSVHEYNARHREQPIPAIVLLVDDLAPLLELYEAIVDNQLMPLMRRSLTFGITVVASANSPTVVRGRLNALFGARLTFRQSNPDLYSDIVGRGAVEFDDTPGRGYIRVARRPLALQAALPVGAHEGEGTSAPREAEELERLAALMRRRAEREALPLPLPIETLPERVPLRALLDEAPAPRPKRIEALLGMSETLTPLLIDLKRTLPHFVIAGPPLSGKTSALYTWLLSLAWRYPPGEVAFVLVDMQRRFVEYGGERSMGDLPHVLATVTRPEALEAVVHKLHAQARAMDERRDAGELFVLIDNFDDLNEELSDSTLRQFDKELATLARRYGQAGLHFVAAGSFDGAGGSEFRRRLLAAGHGLGLRIMAAIEKLRTSFISGMRDRELVVGRGYVVRPGIARMLQGADPFSGMDIVSDPNDDDEEGWKAAALDRWVERIQSRYPGEHALWADGGAPIAEGPAPTASSNGHAGTASSPLLALIPRALLWESKRTDGGPPIIATAMAVHGAGWGQEESVRSALLEVWRAMRRAEGFEEEGMKMILDMAAESNDADAFLRQLAEELPMVEAPTGDIVAGATS